MPGYPSPLRDDVRASAASAGAAGDDDGAVLGPLSYAQEWLWYLDQLEPARSTYGVTHAWRIDGPLDVDALRKGLQWLVDRHASLRTTFVIVDGVPQQRVAQHREFVLAVDDLSVLAADARDAAAAAITREEARRPFDLAHGPLFSGRLLRLDGTHHWLLLPRHHTISGGWRDLATHELGVAYNAFAAGGTPQLPPLPLQYVDYARWQRDTLQGEYLAGLESYWRQRLAGAPTALALPTDHRRPLVRVGDGARIRFTLSAERVDALRALARSTGATLHLTLLAAFHVLLARYTGQDDILIGAPVSGRDRPEFDGVMGMFINTVVHRGELGADPSFRTFVAQTAASAAEAYRHQALPIGRLVQALAPKRDAGRNPLFQAMYSLQDRYETSVPLTFDGTTSEPIDTYNGTSKVDLSLLLSRDGSRLQGMLEYATDLFNADAIETMAGQFVTLVDEIVRDPDRHVSELSLLRPGDRERIVVEWNATNAPFPADRPVHALFSEQARRSPAAIALVAAERTLDYATLDRQSGRLARRLRDSRVLPRSRVGICAGHSLEGVVAMLGVLKAGCAYVPLDPDHPAPRIAALLYDAGAAAVVAVPNAAEALSAWAVSGKPVLLIENLDDASGADAVPVTTGGDDLACVMYTSGSTGAPKGVAVPHRAIARLCLGTDYVQLGTADVVAHLANPAFDAATFEIWAPLLNGASVALLGTDVVLAGDAFAAALDRHGVTTLFLTTALFNHVVRAAPRALNERQVLFGGEAADPRTVHACLADARPRRLLHVYGPTEATTFATWHEVVAVDPDALTVPIGRPLANTVVYVLDPRREPAAIGVPGEIYIGGPGLAHGYLDAPAETDARFVADPFSGTPGARLYRTGDRARYRGDGVLEFLGRLDRQVKIRGHRIEPGEIEAALRQLAGVRDAVIKVHGTTSENRRLAAYVVPAPEANTTPADVWQELSKSLPEYLLPGAMVLVQALPLTATGKVDLNALPDPDELALQRHGWHVRPRNLLEGMLTEIWEPLLGVANVGVHDDFFDLGGHSLLAAQMMDRVERACGVRLPLTTLYDGATIADVAEAIGGVATTGAASVVALRAGGARVPVFFLHGDFSNGGFYTRKLARELGDDQPFYAVHPHGLLTSGVPESIEAMASDRLEAIRRLRPRGPYVLGGHCNGAVVALEIARRLVEAGETVPVLVVVNALAPGLFGRRGQAPPDMHNGETPDVFARYRQALAAYQAAPYRGRIVLLKSHSTRGAHPTLGWDAVGGDLRVHELPGDHMSSVTEHVAAFGERMRAVLDEAAR